MSEFHDQLNPKLWTDFDLIPVVHLKLLKNAITFYQFLNVPKLVIEDIIITGSNCAYTYTPLSDIDLHLVVDKNKTVCPILADDYFQTKKTLWNSSHNISIRGSNVELYIEDLDQPAKSNGRYSILKKKWLIKPSRVKPIIDDISVKLKSEAIAAEIQSLLSGNPQLEDIDDLLERISNMRKSGLMKTGEFSIENLAFKKLRDDGLIDAIRKLRIDTMDKTLSLESNLP